MGKYKMPDKEVKCDDCGKKFNMSYSAWRKNTRLNKPLRCPECRIKWLSQHTKEQFANMNEYEKSERSKKLSSATSNHWASLSDAEIDKIRNDRSITSKEMWATRTDEEKSVIISKISTANKETWANKSDEEMKAWSNLQKEQWANMSEENKNIMANKISNAQKKIWEAKSDEEKAKHISAMLSRNALMTDEEKEYVLHKRRQAWNQWWASLSDEEKTLHVKPMNDTSKERWASLSDEEKLAKMRHVQDGYARWYSSLSEEEKQTFSDKQKQIWANKSDEEMKAWSNLQKEQWANKSDEEKQLQLRTMQDGWDQWWASLSDEEKALHVKPMNDTSKERWASLSDEEKQLQLRTMQDGWELWRNALSDVEKKAISDAAKERWESKSDEEKKEFGYKISDAMLARSLENKIQTANKRDKNGTVRKGTEMVKWFTDMLHTHYGTTYTTDGDHAQHNQDARNMDITIYKDNVPIMVVELDDLWTHGDGAAEYGRTGRHYGIGSEYRDVERGLSIPDGMPFIVICEDGRDDHFHDMMEVLDHPYEEFAHWMYHRLRLQPFPYPSYSNTELVSSFNRLRYRLKDGRKTPGVMALDGTHWDCLYGMHVIYHFHPSIWHDRVDDAHMCPYDAYRDDGTLMDMIKSHMVIHTRNRNKITQCFLLSDVAPRVPIFTPIMAMKVISSYLSEYDTIVDANIGYGGIMLATIAMGKSYIGYDTDIAHVNEASHLASWIRAFSGLDVNAHIECDEPHGTYPCMMGFTTIGDEQIRQWLSNTKCGKYVFVTAQPTDYHVVDTFRYDKAYFQYEEWHIVVITK